MTLISKSKPASQFTPTAVQFGIGRFAERLQPNGVDRLPLRGRIGVERGHVDDVVERAAGGLQHRREIVEGKLDLLFEDRLGRPVLAAADLARDEQKSPERIAAE